MTNRSSRFLSAFRAAAVAAILPLCTAACLAHPKGTTSAPVKIPTFILVTAGQDHTCALTTDGLVYCWGSNQDGQLGLGLTDKLPHPKPLLVDSKLRFTLVTAGYRHTCALTTDGAAYCWGANDSGQLGNGSLQPSASPIPVSGKLFFESLSSGATHTCGVTKFAEGFCWGGNWHGQLGIGSMDGDEKYSCCKTQPKLIASSLSLSKVTAGGIHTCAVTKTGKAYCWGMANYGRLGIGRTSAVNVPTCTPVNTSLEFISIAPGGFYSCGLSKTSIAYCWGANDFGQLGIGPLAQQDVPAEVSGNLRFGMLVPSNNHTCGLTADGTVYCWGANRFGQIGDGSHENRSTPVAVSFALKFKWITTGGNDFSGHTCGITTDNKILCWGDNRWGQLGSGSTTPSSKPVQVAD